MAFRYDWLPVADHYRPSILPKIDTPFLSFSGMVSICWIGNFDVVRIN